MPADLDIGQVLFIAIAMIAAFVQWVWKLIQENKAARERARPQSRGTPVPKVEPEIPPVATPRGGIWDLVETFKEELRKAQEGQSPVPPPPPLPQRPMRPRPAVLAPPPLPPVSVQKSLPVTPEVIVPQPIAAPASVAKAKDHSIGLRMSLMNLDALKQAILLREILGPPKALQSQSDTY